MCFEKCLAGLSKAVDPSVPFLAHALERMEILTQARSDQPVEIGRQFLSSAKHQRVFHALSA
jgi:hypothetical protein